MMNDEVLKWLLCIWELLFSIHWAYFTHDYYVLLLFYYCSYSSTRILTHFPPLSWLNRWIMNITISDLFEVKNPFSLINVSNLKRKYNLVELFNYDGRCSISTLNKSADLLYNDNLQEELKAFMMMWTQLIAFPSSTHCCLQSPGFGGAVTLNTAMQQHVWGQRWMGDSNSRVSNGVPSCSSQVLVKLGTTRTTMAATATAATTRFQPLVSVCGESGALKSCYYDSFSK